MKKYQIQVPIVDHHLTVFQIPIQLSHMSHRAHPKKQLDKPNRSGNVYLKLKLDNDEDDDLYNVNNGNII